MCRYWSSLHTCIRNSCLTFLSNLTFSKINTIENFPNIGSSLLTQAMHRFCQAYTYHDIQSQTRTHFHTLLQNGRKFLIHKSKPSSIKENASTLQNLEFQKWKSTFTSSLFSTNSSICLLTLPKGSMGKLHTRAEE